MFIKFYGIINYLNCLEKVGEIKKRKKFLSFSQVDEYFYKSRMSLKKQQSAMNTTVISIHRV